MKYRAGIIGCGRVAGLLEQDIRQDNQNKGNTPL